MNSSLMAARRIARIYGKTAALILAIVAGIAWSLLLFREQPPPVFWIALLLMLASVFVAVSRKAPAQPV